MPLAAVNGIELYWEQHGEAGAPLVLVHGSWGDGQSWAQLVPLLSRAHRVVTYDRRGHSRSPRPAGPGSAREDAADLAALIERLGLAPAHVLGSSFGGSIALRLAAGRPDLLRSVIVHEPPLFGLLDDPAAQALLQGAGARIAAVLALLERGETEAGARLFVETVAFGPGAWARFPEALRQTFVFNAPTFLDEQRDPDWNRLDAHKLAAFPAPALLTAGGRSEPFFPPVVEKLARLLPRAQMRLLPEADHVPQLSQPERYAEAALSFLSDVA